MPNLTELIALCRLYGYDGIAEAAETFRGLSIDEGRRLAVEFLDTEPDQDLIDDFLHRLAAFVPGSLVDVQKRLVNIGVFYPGILYYQASAAVRDQLLARVDDPGANANHLLKSLAWIGDDVVCRRFHEWRGVTPEWSKRLYMAPDRYAEEAGWTLTPEGTRRDLYFSTCYPIVSAGTANGELEIQQSRSDACRWCGQTLINLLGIDLTLPALAFLGLEGSRLIILSCVRCSDYASIASDIDLRGNAVWRKDNERPRFNGFDSDEWEYQSFHWTLASPRRSPFEAHPNFMYRGTSQIGGYPSWEQDSAFPKCPECRQSMTFIGQVAGSDLDDDMEGHTYAFVCAECRAASTVYQQT